MARNLHPDRFKKKFHQYVPTYLPNYLQGIKPLIWEYGGNKLSCKQYFPARNLLNLISTSTLEASRQFVIPHLHTDIR